MAKARWSRVWPAPGDAVHKESLATESRRPEGRRVRMEHRPKSAADAPRTLPSLAGRMRALPARTTRWPESSVSRRADCRSTWIGSWIQFSPRLSPRTRRNRHPVQVRRVIAAGQAWCPRQDSNLRHRLRRPVDVVIAGAFWRPTWAFCSRPVSPMASCVLWFVPQDIPRRVSLLDEFGALALHGVCMGDTSRRHCRWQLVRARRHS
jgi:hypothetical protein